MTGRALLATTVLLAAMVAPARARQTSFPPDQRVDSIFAAWDRPGSPGCALGMLRDGRLTQARGYGFANLDYDIPITPRSVFYSGSVSKQFTAASVLLLAAQGGVSLDDDVRRWIPELPAYDRAITIRHLIHHTSGLRDIYVLMDLAGLRLEDVFPDDDAIRASRAGSAGSHTAALCRQLSERRAVRHLSRRASRRGLRAAAQDVRTLPLRPMGDDVFRAGNLELRFSTRHGAVDGFTVQAGRVRSIRVERTAAEGSAPRVL